MNEKPPGENEKKEKTEITGNTIAGKKISILLADDDADDRDLFKEAIEETKLNVNLDFAEDGKCLIDLLCNEKRLPDLIFLDLNMPYKTGMECLAEIRNNSTFKDIPVVIYSTSSSIKDLE
ncbi:MAG: response regulator [Bacteroidota bacterium]